MRYKIGIATGMLALAAGLIWAADQPREQKYQQAVDLFESKGDVKSAIKLFEEVAKSPDRNLAARALLYLGSCYEKLGQDGAQRAYERIVRDFGDQPDVAAKARGRLSALEKPAESGAVARRIWASVPSENYVFGDSVSLDGRYLAFIDYGNGGPDAKGSLEIKDTVTGEERQVLRGALPKGRSFNWVHVSPDGKELAYCASGRDEPEQLFIVGMDGANPRRIGEGCPSGWSPDGKFLLVNAPRGPMVAMVSVADGSSRPIAPRALHARFSPDGRYIAFIRPESRFIGTVFLTPANGGPEVSIAEGRNKEVMWAPDGKSLIFVSDRRGSYDLWSVGIAEGKPAGPPQMLREQIDSLLGVSRDGDLYYEPSYTVSDIYTADVDPETGRLVSRPKRITTKYINRAPAWSPDGKSLLYYSQRGPAEWPQAGLSIIVRNMKTREERTVPLKSPIPLRPNHPYWFPDGRSLFAQTFGGRGLLRIDLQTGEDQQLLHSIQLVNAPIGIQTAILSPDGRSVYYLAGDDKSDGTRLLVRDVDGNTERELFRAHSVGVPAVSPVQSRIAFFSGSDRGGWALFTVPTAGGQPIELYHQPDRSLMPVLRSPVWSKDGRHIFFATAPPKGKAGGEIWAIAAGGGEPQPLGIGMGALADLDLHPDGKQLVFTNSEWHDEIWVLKNLLPAVRASR